MTYMTKLLVETVAVGVVMAVLFAVIHFFFMYPMDYIIPGAADWSMDMHKSGAVHAFLAGVFGHLSFEVLKWNKWYCTNGAACQP